MCDGPGCATCTWRRKYDGKPRSILGRLWRFHANFCPGWRQYMHSLPEEEKRAFLKKYNFPEGTFT